MKYFSTRQNSPKLNFIDTVLQGLATDGGLYLPENIPTFSSEEINEMKNMPYQLLAFKIMKKFIDGEIPDQDLENLIEKSYKTFSDKAVTPIKKLNNNQYLLELFHGPTFAFKDLALQFLGNVLQYILERKHEKIVIIGATSGDTGSAAIYGCKSCKNADIFILHPHNLVSDIQRKQMTTVNEKNVFNIALEGNFDDCQSIVKKMFRDQSFLKGRRMVAVNSINWVRIMAQIVYYFYAYFQVENGKKHISFSVPTGNFGDIYAGFLAKKMGLNINKLIIATNKNDILARFINQNDYSKSGMIETISPSMNIQVSSNFERMLFNFYQEAGQGYKVRELMEKFEQTGKLSVSLEILNKIQETFVAYSSDDSQTCQKIKEVFTNTQEILDPHTAIGIDAIDQHQAKADQDDIFINLATAHPAKFPKAITKAGISSLQNPITFDKIMTREEIFSIQKNNIDEVKKFVNKNI